MNNSGFCCDAFAEDTIDLNTIYVYSIDAINSSYYELEFNLFKHKTRQHTYIFRKVLLTFLKLRKGHLPSPKPWSKY